MAAVLACGPGRRAQPRRGRGAPRSAAGRQRPVNVTASGKHELTGHPLPRGPHAAAATTAPSSTAIPVTSLARTYLDLAEFLNHARLIDLLEAGQRQNKLDVGAVRAVIARNPGRHGIIALRAAIAELTDEPPLIQSPLEQAFRELIRSHHLPEPQFNVYVEGELVDVGVARAPARRRGRQLGLSPWQAARSRTTGAGATSWSGPGWRLARFTDAQVMFDPDDVGAELSELLQRRALAAAGEIRSVIDPSSSSAASAIVSDSVGCGWTVSAMSSALAPISSASTVSEIRSPASTPTIPAPSSRWVLALEQQLGHALVAAQAQRPARRAPREDRLLVLDPVGLGPRLGQAHPGHLGIGVGHRRDRLGVELDVEPGDDLGRHLGLVHGLVGQHRLADDVADGVDPGHVGAHLGVDRDEAALVDR